MIANNFLQQLNQEQSSVVERVKPSLVEVSNGKQGFGAGIVWRADGIIVTNAHVIRKHPLQITLRDGRTVGFRVGALCTLYLSAY